MTENVIDRAVRLLRESSKSAYAIALATGISKPTIGKYIRGDTKPSALFAERIVNYFTTNLIEDDKPAGEGNGDATQNLPGIKHTDMERRLLEALERRDRDVDRLLTIIERMQQSENEKKQGGGNLNP